MKKMAYMDTEMRVLCCRGRGPYLDTAYLNTAYPPFGGAVSIYGDPLNPIQIGAKKQAGSPDRLYQSLGYRMSIWYPPKRDAASGGPYSVS